MVSRAVIDAYKTSFTLAELKEMLRIALADRASGVLVTQANMQDAGGSGQMIGGDPNEVIEMLQIAISELENGDFSAPAAAPLSARINFRYRRSET